MRGSGLFSAALVVTLATIPRPAGAQERPSAAVLATAASRGDAELGRSFDRALRARLDALDVVSARGSVALNLADVQLALSCEGESEGCLRAVAEELGVALLIIPNLDRVGRGLVFSVAVFDSAGGGPARRVDRTASGDDAAQGLLGEVDGLLRELFPPVVETSEPVVEVEDEAPVEEPPEVLEAPPPAPAGPDTGRLAAAIGVASVGVIALGVGVGFGVGSMDSANAYAAARPTNELDAMLALEDLRRAGELATVANAMFIVGGVVAAAGCVWAIIEAISTGGEPLDEASVLPLISADGLGLSIWGSL